MLCLRCEEPRFRRELCYEHWKDMRRERYHCTWKPCINPIFALTLCKHHYRAMNVRCSVNDCRRPSHCRQVCRYHYRKKVFPELQKCSKCVQNVYMNGKCFRHFIARSCLHCERPTFCKQLCQRHYMHMWRTQRSAGPTANNETQPEHVNINPIINNQSPVSHSSG